LGKIVWLASYPKSGNTWVRAFLHNYITRAAQPHDVNALTDFSAVECAAAWFGPRGARLTPEQTQKHRPAVHERLTRLHDDLVFVKTHNANLAVHGVPLCTPSVTAGAIYVVRDPRDVALSYAAFLGVGVDEVISFMANPGAANRANEAQVFELLASWSLHARSWVAAPNLLLVRYEDLILDPAAYFGRIVRFLGGEAEPARLEQAIRFSDFATLAAQERARGYKAGASKGGGAFFRVGKMGQWRESLTAAQAAQIEAAHGETMRRFGYA